MYIVKIKDTNETVAFCSREEDAKALASTNLDNKNYKIVVDNPKNTEYK